jgi:phage antirepressor YoqD-like protein/prophage antirepressor-like protein
MEEAVMSEIWNFDFSGVVLRAIRQGGKVWLVVSDLGRACNLSNPQRTARDHCRAPQRLAVPGPDSTVSMVCVTGADIARFCDAVGTHQSARLQAFVTGTVVPDMRLQGQVAALNPQESELVVMCDDGEPRTTSLVVADETERDHKTVIQLVRQNLADFEEFGRVAFEMRPFETSGGQQTREVALLTEPQATLLITYMRNNDKVRAFKKALVREFYRMRTSAPDFEASDALNDPVQLRTVLLASVERELALKQEVATLKPKVEVHDRLVDSGGAMTLREAATTLGVSPQRKLREWMREHGWIYGSGQTTRAYQSQLSAGRLMHRVYLQPTGDGDEVSRVTVKVTPKGLAKLAEVFRTIGAP